MKALLTFFLSIALISCELGCKHQSPCDSVTCKKLQECVDGSCICSGSGYNMGKWCYQKVWGNSYTFYNISQCYGFDTLVVSISKNPSPSTVNEYSVDIVTPRYEPPVAIFPISDGTTFYAKEAIGDTFFIPQMQFMAAKVKGKDCGANISGRMNVNKDTLKLKIVWRTGDPITNRFVAVDSCYKVFTK